MSWLVLGMIIPIVVAWMNGSTYTFAVSLVSVGVVFYFANTVLIGIFVSKRAPQALVDNTWEATAGTGIVPKWVSVIGLLGMGFVPAGLVIAVFLWMGLVANRAEASVGASPAMRNRVLDHRLVAAVARTASEGDQQPFFGRKDIQ
jgi:hypothetical protein